MWIPIDFVSHLMHAHVHTWCKHYSPKRFYFWVLRTSGLESLPVVASATSVGCAPYNFRKEQLETLIILSVN